MAPDPFVSETMKARPCRHGIAAVRKRGLGPFSSPGLSARPASLVGLPVRSPGAPGRRWDRHGYGCPRNSLEIMTLVVPLSQPCREAAQSRRRSSIF